MSGLIGRKIGMTRLPDAAGNYVSCTVIQAGPCVVTQVKTDEKDGYKAIQLGFEEATDKHTPKAEQGHFKKAGTTNKKRLMEFHGFEKELKAGDVLDVTLFNEGDFVDVAGTSKGEGFQGVVKRWGFHGVGSRTHGQHDRQRAPGSAGASSFPSRTWPGKKQAGRTGGVRAKAQNLSIFKILPEKNVLLVKGSIPGYNGSYVVVER
jgi:large subunit ribosomal protein L3